MAQVITMTDEVGARLDQELKFLFEELRGGRIPRVDLSTESSAVYLKNCPIPGTRSVLELQVTVYAEDFLNAMDSLVVTVQVPAVYRSRVFVTEIVKALRDRYGSTFFETPSRPLGKSIFKWQLT